MCMCAPSSMDCLPRLAPAPRPQVVAGTNFTVKVNVGGGEFVHVTVFRSLPPFTVELKGVQTGKSEADAL